MISPAETSRVQTYRELFRVPEFRPLFAAMSIQVAAGTLSGLALGTLVYTRTGSPLLSAIAMFGASFMQVVGAMTLLSAADRVPPRIALAGAALLFCAGSLALAAPGMPIAAMLAVLLCQGLVSSVTGGIRWGLLGEILPEGGYLLGRSVMNMSVGVMQITGFALGGVLVATGISPRLALLGSAALHGTAALCLRFGLTRRAPRAAGRPSVRQTWRSNATLWSSRPRRAVYLSLWVPNGLIVGCEALFVPYAPDAAGVLFVAGALGMLAGDMTAGRFLPARRRAAFVTPLRLLLALPYLVFALTPALPVAVVAVVLASGGFGAGLLLQERLLALTPESMRGHALGLHSSGMLTMQAVGATVAGLVAQHTGPGTAMTVLAAASVLVTLALTPALTRPFAAAVPAGSGRPPGVRADAAEPAAT